MTETKLKHTLVKEKYFYFLKRFSLYEIIQTDFETDKFCMHKSPLPLLRVTNVQCHRRESVVLRVWTKVKMQKRKEL